MSLKMYATLYPYLVYIPCMPDNAAAAVLAELHCQLGRDDAVVRDIHGVRWQAGEASRCNM
jgi:hypothetical protein